VLEAVALDRGKNRNCRLVRVAAAAEDSIAAAGSPRANSGNFAQGNRKGVTVDMRHAVIECRSESYLRVDGNGPSAGMGRDRGNLQDRDQRLVRLHTTSRITGRVGKVLNCKPERERMSRPTLMRGMRSLRDGAYLPVAVWGGFPALSVAWEWSACLTPDDGGNCRDLDRENWRVRAKAMDQALAHGGRRPLADARAQSMSRVIAVPSRVDTLAGARRRCPLASPVPTCGNPWCDRYGRGKLTRFIELQSEQGGGVLRDSVASGGYFSQGFVRTPRAHGFSRRTRKDPSGLVFCRSRPMAMKGHGRNAAVRLSGADRERFQTLRRTSRGSTARRNSWPDPRVTQRHMMGVRRVMAAGAPITRRRQLDTSACPMARPDDWLLESRPRCRWI